MIHKTSCGIAIYNKSKKNIIINCGDDLGGFNGEFAQCSECYKKDLEKKE